PPRPASLALTTVLLALLGMFGPFSIDTPFPAFVAMGEELDVSGASMQLVISAYLGSFAVMSLFHGPISDALGRKPVMVSGALVYALASIGCALAPSLPVLLVFRVLQGASAGAGTIVSRTVVRDLYEGPAAQRLMGLVAMIFAVAPAIAPVMGGWLLLLGPCELLGPLRLRGHRGSRDARAPARQHPTRGAHPDERPCHPRRGRRGRADALIPGPRRGLGSLLRGAVPLQRRRADLRRHPPREG